MSTTTLNECFHEYLKNIAVTKEVADLLEDAISQINDTENLDFVMFTGDQINTPYEKELRKFIDVANKIKYPWYATLGNHDTCVGGYLTKSLYNSIIREKDIRNGTELIILTQQ